MKTINLENAKRLQELGVDKESHFVWTELANHKRQFTANYKLRLSQNNVTFASPVPAYTADEIGDMLPESITVNGSLTYLRFSKDDSFGKWWIYYSDNKTNLGKPVLDADTMADAMALMLIWLIENRHVYVNDIKEG